MARNDVSHDLARWERAHDRDCPEASYLLRVASAHFFEAEYAVKAWRQHSPEVREFINALPRDAIEELRKASTAIGKLGQAVEHSRNRTFHYPYPASKYPSDEELRDALDALGRAEVLVVSQRNERLARLYFADDVAFELTLGKYDRSALRAQGKVVGTGAWGFVNFATCAWEAYCDVRGLELGIPALGD